MTEKNVRRIYDDLFACAPNQETLDKLNQWADRYILKVSHACGIPDVTYRGAQENGSLEKITEFAWSTSINRIVDALNKYFAVVRTVREFDRDSKFLDTTYTSTIYVLRDPEAQK